jgi:thiamine biosynthesis lipoprotein
MKQSSRSKLTPLHSYIFEALGTRWSVETPRDLLPSVKHAIQTRLEKYDRAYSRFRDDSIVARMAESAGTYRFPADFSRLYGIYEDCYRLTDGAMTPLIGSVLEDAGYDKQYSLIQKPMRQLPRHQDVQWDGERTLTTKQPIVLDIGAAGKGYAVDLIGSLLETSGIDQYVVDASGDMRHRGKDSQRIGLESPFDAAKVIGVWEIENKSLCASATNRRAWRGMHHVFDARTLAPTSEVIATWVVADDTLTADAVATALFFVQSADTLYERFSFQYVRMFANGTLDYSPGFDGELFI